MDDIARLGYAIDSTQARTAAKDLDAMNASAGRAERGAVSLKRASQNLLRDEKGRFISAADSASKYGAEIESLRMKYNPLYAASMRFEAAQNEIKRALELGAISANQAKVAYAGLQAGMVGSARAGGAYGKAMSNAGMHTANVFAQLNDIGVMMASGQNPIQLALQQGTQLNQVWGQMGGNIRSVGGVLASAFMSVLNPLNLLTIGIIAGAAALVGWAKDAWGASDNARTLEDALSDLQDVSSTMKQSQDILAMSAQELSEKYGIYASEVRDAAAALGELSVAESKATLSSMVTESAKAIDEFLGRSDSVFRSSKMMSTAILDISNSLGISFNEARNLYDAMSKLSSAVGFDQQVSALRDIESAMKEAGISADQLPGSLRGALIEANQLTIKMAETNQQAEVLSYTIDGGISGALNRASGFVGALYSRVAGLSGAFSGPINSANALANAIGNVLARLGAVGQGMAKLADTVTGGLAGGVMGALSKGTEVAAASMKSAGETLAKFVSHAKQLKPVLVGGSAGGGGGGRGGAAGAVKKVAEEMSEAEKAAKSYSDTMQKYVVDGIGKAVDWMVDGFKGGLKGLVNIFKDTIKQMIAFALKNRIMIGLGLAPGAAMAGGAGGLIGGGGGGILGQLGGFGSAFSSGMTGLASAVFGAGGGIGAGFSYLGSTLASATTSLTGFATALGAFAPVIGGIVALGKALFGRTLKDTGIEGKITASGFEGGTYKFYKGGLLRSDKTKRKPLEEEADAALDRAIRSIYQSVKVMGKSLGLGADALRKFSKDVKFSTKGMSEEQAMEELQRQLEGVGDDMAQLVLGTKRFTREGETAFQTLQRLSSNLAATNSAFSVLGFTLFEASLKGAAGATRFVDALGGIDAMNSKVAFYFDNFYSEAEKLTSVGKELRRGFRGAGITRIPKTMEEYKRLIDRLEDAGRVGKVAKLIDLAPVFKQFEDLQDAIRTQRQAERDARLNERQGLLRRLYELQGRTNMIRRLELRALDPLNRQLQRRIWNLEREAAINDEREGLERRLLEAQGDTAALRRLEIQSVAYRNRALLREILNLERANERANERAGLERELLELQGDTATLRQMELDALFPANRALQRQIWALQDQADAADRAREALDALDMNDFASRLEYARAQGRAAAGLPVTNIGGSVIASTASTTTSGGDTLSANAESIEQMRAALVSISTKVGYLLNLNRKWDADGLPETRT